MADEYDVSSKRLTTTGAAAIGRARVRLLSVTVSSAGAGRLTVTSGDGGATLIDLDLSANTTHQVFIPGNGVLFQNDPFVATATNVTSATLFWS